MERGVLVGRPFQKTGDLAGAAPTRHRPGPRDQFDARLRLNHSLHLLAAGHK
ncbi:hypothetical protein [Streptomyces sp. SM11]|uniref:hypothetical protein n=1 Tax=Streptomyces sp. SM11 TaxID=565557 RepID=UPI002155FFD4|nr:hypothetical protein [Streptomyces sp. SM11]